MNIVFMDLSDGTTAITDENGHIIKKEIETSKELLLLENKIEIVNNKVKETAKKISDQKSVQFLSKGMLISQPIIVILITVGGFIFGGISEGCFCLAYGGSICTVSCIYFGIAKLVSKRKLKGLEGKFEKAKELKIQYESELVQTKEKQTVLSNNLTVINEPISLIQQNNFELSKIEEQLEVAYSNAVKKPKRLMLKRKTDNKI